MDEADAVDAFVAGEALPRKARVEVEALGERPAFPGRRGAARAVGVEALALGDVAVGVDDCTDRA